MTEAAEHPDVDEISDLTEGLLTPARSEEIRQHLESCTDCREVYESLEEIRGLLGTLPPSTPMPLDVAERIDAALAAEALLAVTSPEGASASETPADGGISSAARASTADETHGAETRKPRTGAHVSRETAAVSRETSTGSRADRPAGRAQSGTGPGRGRRTRGRRRMIGLGTVFTLAALGLGGLVFQVTGDSPTTATDSTTTDSGVSLSERNLEARVGVLLGQQKGSATTESDTDKPSFDVKASPKSPSSKAPIRGQDVTTKIPACIQKGTGRTASPLAAEQATYQGESAYLVVLPHRSDAQRVSAYVVAASCAEQGKPEAGELLSTHSYVRR